MQFFIDQATGKPWAFEDDVKVTLTNGVYSFSVKHQLPPVIVSGEPDAETGAETYTLVPGDIVDVPLAHVPTTLKPCSEDEASKASEHVLSTEETVAANKAQRDALLNMAANAIDPLQDAVDLGIATDSDATALKAWKQYRIAVAKTDLVAVNPTWPAAPSA